MDKELVKLIEENGLTLQEQLHGDIEFFAHLVAEREREACAKLVMDNYHMFQTVEAAKSLANGILEREHG
jgi:hypothetical protein